MGLPAVLAGMGIAGAGVQAFGAYETGQATAAAANYQAQVAQNNAKIAAMNARQEAAAGKTRESALGMKIAQSAGGLKANLGASGINVNTGSAAAAQEGVAKVGAMDIGTERSNTAKAVYGYEVQRESDLAQAQLLQMEGSQAAEAGDIGALGTFLSGASSVGSKYATMQG
jgi:hypothetical protein